MENKVNYKKEIIKMLERIEDAGVIVKIFTVVKTHLKILKDKERD